MSWGWYLKIVIYFLNNSSDWLTVLLLIVGDGNCPLTFLVPSSRNFGVIISYMLYTTCTVSEAILFGGKEGGRERERERERILDQFS